MSHPDDKEFAMYEQLELAERTGVYQPFKTGRRHMKYLVHQLYLRAFVTLGNTTPGNLCEDFKECLEQAGKDEGYGLRSLVVDEIVVCPVSPRLLTLKEKRLHGTDPWPGDHQSDADTQYEPLLAQLGGDVAVVDSWGIVVTFADTTKMTLRLQGLKRPAAVAVFERFILVASTYMEPNLVKPLCEQWGFSKYDRYENQP